MIENMVPEGGQTAPFRGVWRVLGGFPLLDRFWCRSPTSPESLAASGLLGHLLAAKLPLKTHLKAGEKNTKNRFSLRSAWKPCR